MNVRHSIIFHILYVSTSTINILLRFVHFQLCESHAIFLVIILLVFSFFHLCLTTSFTAAIYLKTAFIKTSYGLEHIRMARPKAIAPWPVTCVRAAIRAFEFRRRPAVVTLRRRSHASPVRLYQDPDLNVSLDIMERKSRLILAMKRFFRLVMTWEREKKHFGERNVNI